jgi:hypothetical protein
VSAVTEARRRRAYPGCILDDATKLMVWACKRQLLTGDDEELRSGPGWLARSLHDAPSRPLAQDIVTLAVVEARRAVEVDPELEGDYAACLQLLAAFEADTRALLDEHDRYAAA